MSVYMLSHIYPAFDNSFPHPSMKERLSMALLLANICLLIRVSKLLHARVCTGVSSQTDL